MLKAVAFDMDDTLLSINLTAFIAVFARDEARLLADIGRKSPLSALAGLGGVLHDLNANARDEDDARTNRATSTMRSSAALGIPLGDPVIADAFEYYEREGASPQKRRGHRRAAASGRAQGGRGGRGPGLAHRAPHEPELQPRLHRVPHGLGWHARYAPSSS